MAGTDPRINELRTALEDLRLWRRETEQDVKTFWRDQWADVNTSFARLEHKIDEYRLASQLKHEKIQSIEARLTVLEGELRAQLADLTHQMESKFAKVNQKIGLIVLLATGTAEGGALLLRVFFGG